MPFSFTNILLCVIVILLALVTTFTLINFFSKKKPQEQAGRYNPNIQSVVRDVLIKSLNGGQFPLALITLVIIIGIVVMGGNNVYNLFQQVLEVFKSLYILGWLFFVLTVFISTFALWRARISYSKQKEILERENEMHKEKLQAMREEIALYKEQAGSKKQQKR